MPLFRDKPELLLAFRRGDRAALETVYRHYATDVARILRLGFVTGSARARVPGLRDDDALRDAIQEVFLRAFKQSARASYEDSRPYRPFLLQIARNLRLDQMRRTGREVHVHGVGGQGAEIDIDLVIERNQPSQFWAEGEPQARREWEGLLAQTRQYVAGLDAESQRFVQLRFVDGLPQEEVARLLGVTRRLVRTLEERVLAGLRRLLKR